MQTEKKCNHCGSSINLIVIAKRFNKRKQEDKTYYVCRVCNTERARRYAKTPEGRLARREAVKRSIKKHYAKQMARIKLNYHVRVGNIPKPDACSVCKQKIKVEAHHSNYKKPLEVKWVCRPCHADLERTL